MLILQNESCQSRQFENTVVSRQVGFYYMHFTYSSAYVFDYTLTAVEHDKK